MTTIAYRNGVIAADTHIWGNGTLMGFVTKIARNDTGDLAGACGTGFHAAQFLDWFRDGEKGDAPHPVPVSEQIPIKCRAIIIRSTGTKVVEMYEDGDMHQYVTEYVAIGSGRDIAYGGMFHGVSAMRAVAAAITLDESTGGSVEFYRHDTPGIANWESEP